MKGILILLLICPVLGWTQEKVFYNAKIFTADPQKPFAEAIAFDGKMIMAVGTYNEVKKKTGARAEWVDLKGGFLMPGLIDTHNHAIQGGHLLTKPNTNDKLLNATGILTYAREELKKKEGMTGDVLIIYGLNITSWQFIDEFNQIFNDGEFKTQPLVLRGSDHHTGWCNQAMLTKAGITRAYVESLKPQEKIYFGIKDGEPNGFVSESGFRKVESTWVAENDLSKAAEKTIEYCNRYGITAWLDPAVANVNQSSAANSKIIEGYRSLIDRGKLTAHVVAVLVADANADPQSQINSAKGFQKKFNTTNFSIVGFKIFGDGVIESPTHTAALSIPYTGTQSRGDLLFDPQKFARFATAADKENMLVHVHAIGDRAVTEALNGFEAARKANQNKKIPHTLTHLQIVLPSDFDRFADLNVLASYQLYWAFGDITTIDIVKPYIDPSLYQWQYPVRSMLQAGATITGASDWPVTTANPFEAIYRAETRKGPMGVLDSLQCMPRVAMLYAYTSEAAKALMMEKNIGSLQAGKYADMILLDRDVLTVSPEAMMNTRVLWTMFEGKKVYEMKE